jgi:tetratricopeptide (TPR) repeat protein
MPIPSLGGRFLVIACALLTQPAFLEAQAPSARPAIPNDSLDALLEAAERHHYAGRLDAAHETLARAESAVGGSAGPAHLARVETARGLVWLSATTASNRGYAEADRAAGRALELAERSGDSLLIADAAELAGRVHYARRINLAAGGYDAPLRHFERALALRRAAGDTGGTVEALFRVGLIHERQGDGDRAIALYQEGMRLAASGYPLERSHLARHLGYQHLRRGDLDRAMTFLRQSHELREQAGAVLVRSPSLASIGEVYRRKGDHARAREYVERALAEAERIGASRFVVQALIALGEIEAATERVEQAGRHWRRAETLAGEIGYVSGVEQARELLGRQ